MDPNAVQIQMPTSARQQEPSPAQDAPKPAPPPRPALSSASDLLKLLPTGTVLAFQALAPSFSNHGAVLGRDGKLYHGAATLRGFYPFNFAGTREERGAAFRDLSRLRITALDLVHAFFSALVFLAVALADASVQGCLFPDAGPDVRELLVNLPLGAGFLSSMVFMIFPTTRKSIGYTDMAPHAQ
ncbi:unnamed protein product [Urochloa humidicola]